MPSVLWYKYYTKGHNRCLLTLDISFLESNTYFSNRLVFWLPRKLERHIRQFWKISSQGSCLALALCLHPEMEIGPRWVFAWRWCRQLWCRVGRVRKVPMVWAVVLSEAIQASLRRYMTCPMATLMIGNVVTKVEWSVESVMLLLGQRWTRWGRGHRNICFIAWTLAVMICQ